MMAAAKGHPSHRGASWLRIVGGELRGQRIRYSGDGRVRPMRDRVRESLFNLLGDRVKGRHAVDLFAGTGALGIEALSRGAMSATFLDRHAPTLRVVRENLERLGLGDRAEALVGDAFRWAARPESWPARPWICFCCPPYRLVQDRAADMDALLATFAHHAPAGSTLVVEAPESFDRSRLPEADAWDVRAYPPAVLAIRDIPPTA